MDYEAEARRIAREANIPEDMFVRQIRQESGFRPDAVSEAGAQGIAQFMPDTAAEWGVDVSDPISSLDGAARYMTWLKDETGSWEGALQAYNGGIGNYEKYGGNIPFEETQNYVATILGPQNELAVVDDTPNSNGIAVVMAEPSRPDMPRFEGLDLQQFMSKGRFV